MSKITYPFNQIPSLDKLDFTPEALPFSETELTALDKELHRHERLFLDPDIEKSLISKSELLASFAISKAEKSTLTLGEANKINKELDLSGYKAAEKLFAGSKVKPSAKVYEKLEFLNIAETFSYIKSQPFKLSPQNIQTLHHMLSQGLDKFPEFIPGRALYHPGQWRQKDNIRVGDFAPPQARKVEKSVAALVKWYTKKPSIINTALFHAALYYLHPFQNGNKRVCHILEYQLLREIKLNKKNLYNVSYYYHREKERYYKYLTTALEKKNLGFFAVFFQEALAYSIVGVFKTAIEFQRKDFLNKVSKPEIRKVLTPLVKRKELQFKHLYRTNKRKVARQTLVNYLQRAKALGIITRRESGRAVFYYLNLKLEEEKIYRQQLAFVRKRLPYTPSWLLT